MHLQPVFADAPFYTINATGSVSEHLFEKGLCLPFGSALTNEDLDRVVRVVAGD